MKGTNTEIRVRSILTTYGAPEATGEIMDIFNGANRKKLTDADVRTIRLNYKTGMTQEEIAGYFGINRATVSRIVRGEYW